MIPGFEAIVEERIKKAQKDGQMDNLEGARKPLKLEQSNVPEELKLAHKILKNAGFLPPEVELRKKISSTENLLSAIEYGSPERQRVQKKLNYYMTKLDMIRGTSSGKHHLVTEIYREQIIKKLS